MGLFSELNECVREAGYSFANWENENLFWRIITRTLQSRIYLEIPEIFTNEERRSFEQLNDPGEIMGWIDDHAKTLGIPLSLQVKRIKKEIKQSKDVIMNIQKAGSKKETRQKKLDPTHEEMKRWAIDAGITFKDSDDEHRFLDIVVSELEVRIGAEISSKCTQEELAEFDRCNGKEVGQWLQKHVPDYRSIVEEKRKMMKEEIRNNADYIMLQKKRIEVPDP